MKATGIVRRIDDLGRIVIPKEIRRTLRIREGDALEIFTDSQGGVIFRKYSPVGEMWEFAGQYADVLHRISGRAALVCDCDKVVAVSGASKRDYAEKNLSGAMEDYIKDRKSFSASERDGLEPTEGGAKNVCVMAPIIAAGDAAGAVLLLSDSGEKPGEADVKLVQAAAAFLGKQMED